MEQEELTAGLCGRLGLESIEPDESGRFALAFDDMPVEFAFDEDGERILLSADLGAVPENGVAFLMKQMLQTNHRLAETDGASLSIDEDGERICLRRSEPLSALDLDRFVRILERFVNLAVDWRQVFAEADDIESMIDSRRDELEAERRHVASGDYLSV